LFYTTWTTPGGVRVWRHRIGTPAAEDTMVFEETDEKVPRLVEPEPQRAAPDDQVHPAC